MSIEQCPIIDITPTLGENLAVWPGATPFKRQIACSFERGHHFALSSIQTTLHIGAHTDAPNHYHPQGEGIHQRSLHYYLGECQVVQVEVAPGERIFPQHLAAPITAQRVLFKTRSFSPQEFNQDFNALSVELVNFLADRGVILVGLDTPSVDLFDDKEMLSHHAIYRHDMAILEGVTLDHVDPNASYHLIALPLPIQDGDASPVRAVLLKKPENKKP